MGNRETRIQRGARAAECLGFLDEFIKNKRGKLWDAIAHQDREQIEALSAIAVTVESFKDFLEAVRVDGMVADHEEEK